MKHLCILIVLLAYFSTGKAQFEKYFFDKTLRFDYYHCGNSTEDHYYYDKMMEEPFWGGSKVSLIDNTGYGNYEFRLYDLENNELIYSRGFCTLFGEWQTIDEAKTIDKCFPESVVMPYPRNKTRIEFLSRNKKGIFEKKFEYIIDPESYFIKRDREKLPTFDLVYSGAPDKKVDIVLIPEGYTADQLELFKADCQTFTDAFFTYSPYKENKNKFNIRGVWAPSLEAGPDIPGEHIWNKTRLEASYYTFGSERYQMITDFQKVRDVAANAPYDYIYVLSNTAKYGGGAIYNFYGISAAHHESETGKIYIHEFGHLFLGLGDEYVGGSEYNDFYPVGVEPWEANLTTLVDFDKKWKNMLAPGTKIPTPVDKPNSEKLGVYEGGGYVDKGVYRPWVNCMMNNIHTIDIFCPVCQKAIQGMIDFQCK